MAKTVPCPRCDGEVPLPESGSEIPNCPFCDARLAKNRRGFALEVCEALLVVVPLFGYVLGYAEKQMRGLSLAVVSVALICAIAEFGRAKLRVVDEAPADAALSQSTTAQPSQPEAGELRPARHFSLFWRRSPFGR